MLSKIINLCDRFAGYYDTYHWYQTRGNSAPKRQPCCSTSRVDRAPPSCSWHREKNVALIGSNLVSLISFGQDLPKYCGGRSLSVSIQQKNVLEVARRRSDVRAMFMMFPIKRFLRANCRDVTSESINLGIESTTLCTVSKRSLLPTIRIL